MFINPGEQPDVVIPSKTMRTIRVTERALFKGCRRQHELGYMRKLQPVNQVADARLFGTHIHSCLAAYYTSIGHNDNKDLDAAESDARSIWLQICEGGSLPDDLINLGTGMLEGYFKYAESADQGLIRVVAVEHQFTARIPGTNITLSGTVDAVIQTKSGYWILDHKTYRTLLTEQQVEFDDQLTAYIWLLGQNGIQVRGAMYNMLLKRIPTAPAMLQSGKLSRNKGIGCDYNTYLNTIRSYDLDVNDYEDILTYFKECPPEFFNRITLTRSQRTIQSFAEYLPAEARDMVSATTVRYPTFSRQCAFCDFAGLCRTITDKGDVELALERFTSWEDRLKEESEDA